MTTGQPGVLLGVAGSAGISLLVLAVLWRSTESDEAPPATQRTTLSSKAQERSPQTDPAPSENDDTVTLSKEIAEKLQLVESGPHGAKRILGELYTFLGYKRESAYPLVGALLGVEGLGSNDHAQLFNACRMHTTPGLLSVFLDAFEKDAIHETTRAGALSTLTGMLRKLPSQEIPALVRRARNIHKKALQDRNEQVRVTAVLWYFAYQPDQDTPQGRKVFLERFLRDPSEQVAQVAAFALRGKVDGDTAIASQASALFASGTTPERRATALYLLASTKLPEARAATLEALTARDGYLLQAGIRTAALLEMDQAIPKLMDLIRLPDEELAWETKWLAIDSLRTMGSPRALHSLVEAYAENSSPDRRTEILQCLRKAQTVTTTPGVAEKLIECYDEEPNADVRKYLIDAVGTTETPAARQWIRRIFDRGTGTPEVQKAAWNLLWRFEEPEFARKEFSRLIVENLGEEAVHRLMTHDSGVALDAVQSVYTPSGFSRIPVHTRLSLIGALSEMRTAQARQLIGNIAAFETSEEVIVAIEDALR